MDILKFFSAKYIAAFGIVLVLFFLSKIWMLSSQVANAKAENAELHLRLSDLEAANNENHHSVMILSEQLEVERNAAEEVQKDLNFAEQTLKDVTAKIKQSVAQSDCANVLIPNPDARMYYENTANSGTQDSSN